MNFIGVEEVDFAKGDGLVPVVAQEAVTGKILMLAYANREALERTMITGFAHYFSRRRGRLWRKGEDSGHVQRVMRVQVDCDGDSLVYVVEQTGPACHTGEESCFYRGVMVRKRKKP
ncbi:MAG: phosphoribosyl-AMP cyclohydrolase [Thaumarchaeota archaeon]|nr:MAG: phosphoribosyl-AMP cyclohydrolase [Nitrososphaerota archaeon]